ncbi:hypothetical protein FB45DRAFT_957079 [Roridomyces roridus]|uniref:Uncharacterized protein n=1 Tax=Roridomyces roridus TaxID=1738132 RepID=A0AAD7AYJ4_9AGAR|nr:hypothetical protein FB45DRAFT_957079 [Roridomyces roridus]
MAALETSFVAFPTTDKNYQPAPRPRAPHLPFRRISLPSNTQRESVVSVASFDSLPEEEGDSPSSSPMPAVTRNVATAAGRKSKVRPMSSTSRKPGKLVADSRDNKRRKVVQEFYQTEKAYVDGLEMIYSQFLAPIIASLDTPQPLLQRSDLASVFSNFVDIWNLHRAFFASLSDQLSIDANSTTLLLDPPALSPVLLSHFPYLSLYNPFVTSFPTTISAMSNLVSPPTTFHPNPLYNPVFAAYLLEQEAHPCCGKLKLRDWLLTIVQRCPRYLLLLKDLIACTDVEDPEHSQLSAVHALVSKITLTLNTAIHNHAQTLSLIALQRATPSLTFQLIVPGRTLVRRGPLSHVERSAPARDREFLLFSDCLLWLEAEENSGWGASAASSPSSALGPAPPSPIRPSMARTRSKSEAELPARNAAGELVSEDNTRSAMVPQQRKSAYHHPISRMKRRRNASAGGTEEGRWVYKGRASLVDLEVVVVTPPREVGEERRFEVLSPEGSFVLYADSEEERDAWTGAIRQTKAQLFVSLNATHPDSTLTSSASTAHLRRSLQALPRLVPASGERKAKGKNLERRERVEHWVPAIWIPDEKTEGCMRCGRPFGWRRRRHHCRLCGRCVCAGCSERTFFISDPNTKDDASKPARACNACYETVFPVLPPEHEDSGEGEPQNGMLDATNNGLTNSLSNFPSWLSMPSLPLAGASTTEALMALDRKPGHQPQSTQSKYERLRGVNRGASSSYGQQQQGFVEVTNNGSRVRVRSPPPRPRSYHQILEDFEGAAVHHAITSPVEEEEDDEEGYEESTVAGDSVVDLSEPSPSVMRNEDTARRNKRFSTAAVALQTTSVTARTQVVQEVRVGGGPGTRTKRFSLVLGTRPTHVPKSHSGDGAELGKGVAAGRLSELLGRHHSQSRTAA